VDRVQREPEQAKEEEDMPEREPEGEPEQRPLLERPNDQIVREIAAA
jgi:hypothetical protein